MNPDKTPSPRYHAFDALRSAMMIFGVIMHAGLSYSRMPANPIWPVKDPQRTPVADWFFDASGLFRMAAFFLMAGFFAGMLVSKRGEAGFLRNRVRRLVIPFALGWAIGFPLLRAAFAVASAPEGQSWWSAIVDSVESGKLLVSPYPMHLWFLEYLLIYCLAGSLFRPLFEPLNDLFRKFAAGPFFALGGVLVTAPLLAYSRMPGFGTPLSFAPDMVSLLAYGVFFAAGWGLFANVDLLNNIRRWAWPTALAAASMLIFAPGGGMPFGPPSGGEMPPFPKDFQPPFDLPFPKGDFPMGDFPFPKDFPRGNFPSPSGMEMPKDGKFPMPNFGGFGGGSSKGWAQRLPGAARTALVTWLLVLGITGLFLRYLDRPLKVTEFLSRSSYWLYLAHFPVVAWLALPLRSLDAPGWLKFSLVVTLSISSLLGLYAIYHRVRSRG